MKAQSQSAACAALAHNGEVLKELAASDPSKIGTRLQTIVCAAIPVYNIFASMEGWPQIPLPAFCTVPPAGREAK